MSKGSSTDRGYGTAHQRARRAALAQLRDGDPCHFCGQPMHHTQRLALDHSDDRTTYRGLTHATCNQLDGARKGGRTRAATRHHPRPWHSRNW